MKYKLNIQKFVENTEYKAQLKIYEEERKQRGGYRENLDILMPEKMLSLTALEVELTEEQFEKMKKSVLEAF